MLANSADPDQTAPREDQGLHCLLVYLIFSSHHTMVDPLSLYFREFTVMLGVVQKFRNFTVDPSKGCRPRVIHRSGTDGSVSALFAISSLSSRQV